MTTTEARSRQFLTDLFAGPFRGHGVIMDAPMGASPGPGDFISSPLPAADWLPWVVEGYEHMVRWHEALDDDAMPTAKLWTGTEIFAAAFGCDIHVYEGMPPAARPLVCSTAEADRLPQPDLQAWPMAKVFELGHLVRERLGPEVPIGVPDIQSPFDIAALVWNKEDLFIAMVEEPEAVHRLVAKCHRLLVDFFTAFQREFSNVNLCHCPNAWAPPALGCWLSEDEAGSMSTAMFEEFCLPTLTGLSEQFGGLFMHCCASADHQYGQFRSIPSLRGLNRIFQEIGPRPAIKTFAGHTVLMVSWVTEETVYEYLAMAEPDTRYLFNVGAPSLDEAQRIYERLRARCPRLL